MNSVLKLDVEKEGDVDEATFERILTYARGLTDLCVKYRDPHLVRVIGAYDAPCVIFLETRPTAHDSP